MTYAFAPAAILSVLSYAGTSALTGGFALAHEVFADGSLVPPWIKSQCCGPADAHHLTAEQVHVTPDGYKVDGYARPIREDRLLPSPDGTWWVFYRTFDDGSQSTVYCFFGPPNGS